MYADRPRPRVHRRPDARPAVGRPQGAGCDRIFRDTFPGATANRPGLTQALDHLRPGDTLVVWRLDRLRRSLRHLIETITSLHERGVGFRSLTGSIDTTTSSGKLIFHIFGALAEFERDLIRERTHAGLVAARARGSTGGRPKVKAFQDPRKLAAAGGCTPRARRPSRPSAPPSASPEHVLPVRGAGRDRSSCGCLPLSRRRHRALKKHRHQALKVTPAHAVASGTRPAAAGRGRKP